MKLIKWALIGAGLYALVNKLNKPAATPVTATERGGGGTYASPKAASGLAAIFETREAADLAVEHLVQERGVERTAIFVEAVGDENSSGTDTSGGDHAAPQQGAREDAPLNGALRLTVAIGAAEQAVIEETLRVSGAKSVRAI